MDFSAIHNESLTKKYLFEQKIRLLDHSACSPIDNLWRLIVAKVYEGGQQYSTISELKNAILDTWEKYLLFNFRNYLIVCQAEFLRLSKLTVDLKILNKKFAFIFYSSARWSYIYVQTKF